MNILAINPGHNGSAALLVDGEIKFYIEEERLSRNKYDGNPFRGILEAIKHGVDILVLGGTSSQFPQLPWTGEDPYSALVRKFNPNVKVYNLGHLHHLGHASAAFYNSGFDEAVALIVDGSGSRQEIQINERGDKNPGFETETIFNCDYEEGIKAVFQSFGGNYDTIQATSEKVDMDSSITTVKAYEAVSDFLGFGFIEAGKTMGLAPYGKYDEMIPEIFIKGRGNRNLFHPSYPAGAFVDVTRNPYLNKIDKSNLWHQEPDRITDVSKNIAWAVQDETQTLVGDLIEKAVAMTDKKNIVIAGGYGLNCVANYYYKKRFPDLNIYVDPISHDGGTAIGLAQLVHYTETKDTAIRPLGTLYLGPEREESYDFDDIETSDVKPADVAKLISEKNIVALYQGRSEAGPRALGNRSILYDPTDPNGKDTVNKVKGREWFRPFAGSMMQEHFEEWFDTYGMEESPFMMYAMDFKLEKHGECPAITHVDGTCRIQTVTKEQNETYHTLIDEFRKITGVPILFNTSFNLAGEPLVETLEDAMKTIKNSDINYLYLPEMGKLVHYPYNDSVVEDLGEEAA
jgi:carbamoyltransferase